MVSRGPGLAGCQLGNGPNGSDEGKQTTPLEDIGPAALLVRLFSHWKPLKKNPAKIPGQWSEFGGTSIEGSSDSAKAKKFAPARSTVQDYVDSSPCAVAKRSKSHRDHKGGGSDVPQVCSKSHHCGAPYHDGNRCQVFPFGGPQVSVSAA
jgi:hypothetical protein